MISQIKHVIIDKPHFVLLFLAAFTSLSNYLNYAYFGQTQILSIVLGFATALITLICYLIYKWVIGINWFGKKRKIILALLFPLFYLTALTVIFGIYGSVSNYNPVNASLKIQVYLMVWSFLGNSFFYTIFSPKIALFLTNLLIVCLFFVQIKFDKQQ